MNCIVKEDDDLLLGELQAVRLPVFGSCNRFLLQSEIHPAIVSLLLRFSHHQRYSVNLFMLIIHLLNIAIWMNP